MWKLTSSQCNVIWKSTKISQDWYSYQVFFCSNWQLDFPIKYSRSWSWSKETYLSGKMSVISFSNQFSGCFSHNSGEFLVGTRRGDPFIPCLPPPTVPCCTTRWNCRARKGSIPLYHACLSTARPLPTVSCLSFSVHGRPSKNVEFTRNRLQRPAWSIRGSRQTFAFV